MVKFLLKYGIQKQLKYKKKLQATEYTGNISTEKSLSLFGLDIHYKSAENQYEDYDKEINYEPLKIFSLKLPIGLKKIHYLEKNDIMYIYDKDTAYQYATSQIRYEIAQTFKEGDKILRYQINKTK